jgi:hypothetical protein
MSELKLPADFVHELDDIAWGTLGADMEANMPQLIMMDENKEPFH